VHRQVSIEDLKVAFNIFIANGFTDGLYGGGVAPRNLRRVLGAVDIFQSEVPAIEGLRKVCAFEARRTAAADEIAFNHDAPTSPACERVGDGKARDATADDHHIGLDVFVERV
jgi:hypothetical protein